MSTQGTGRDPEVRLRAADPAADAEPDLRSLRAAVDARLARDAQASRDARGTQAATDAGTGSSADPAEAVEVVDELAARRERRRWSVRIASVAAAALVVGAGGGYVVAAMDDGAGDSALPVIALDGGGSTSGGSMPDMAPSAGEARAEAGAADMAYGGYSGRVVFTHAGLSTERATGRVWGFDARAAWSEDTVRRAAAALGVTGEPERQDHAWRVGPQDGSAAAVEIYPDATVSLSYWDPAKDPWRCDVAADVVEPRPAPEPDASVSDGAAAVEGGAEILPVEPACDERDLGPAPSGEAASDALRDVLGAMGVDVGAYEVVVDSEGDGPWTHVTAHHVLDGRRTGTSWSAGLTGAGLSSLYGQLAPLVDLGEYDVVSPAEAVERLMDPRFGAGGPVGWLDGREPVWSGPAEVAAPADPPATPGAGSALPWPVDDVTIVEARLGSAMHWGTDSSALLVPTYELVDTDGAIWTVVAVADEHLDTAR